MLIRIIAELQCLVVEISCIVLYSYLRERVRSPRSVATVDLEYIANFGTGDCVNVAKFKTTIYTHAQNELAGELSNSGKIQVMAGVSCRKTAYSNDLRWRMVWQKKFYDQDSCKSQCSPVNCVKSDQAV